MAGVVVVSEPFGTALRRLRECAGLTQEQLAGAARLSTNAISALERGDRRHPYPHTVRALAVALKLSAEERAALEAGVPRRGSVGSVSAQPPVSAQLPAPRQLPAVARDFIGRKADLARLDALLPAADTEEGDQCDGPVSARAVRTAVISAIDGTAGVGKTTLAVMWAHRVGHLFPDGQLYVNLRGYDPGPPAKPEEVLDGFLRALNIRGGMIPPTVQERAALFRSLVDGRRMLVVLDNANSAEQVRPLLPGSPSCLVVVTSRASLTGLAVSVGSVRINLDLLPSEDAVALLRAIIGGHRADAQPEVVAELARLCARLPLALQVAGQRAAARPHTPLVDLVAELADEAQRLEVLSAGTDEFTSVRAVFSWSQRSLPDAQARMFKLLGLHPGRDISGHAAACLADVTPTEARWLLDGLAEAHLVEPAGPGRFRSHDLLHAYAREHCVASHTAESQHHAVRRMVGFYLHTAAAADHLLHPGRRRTLVDGAPAPGHPVVFTGYDQALAWCETERANLVAVTRTAAEAGMHAAAWQLPNDLWSFFNLRKHWNDSTTLCRIGLAAAHHLGDPHGQGRMLNGLGTCYRGLRRHDEAIDHFRQARDFFGDAGDRWGEGSALVNLGDAYLGLRRYNEALGYSRQALDVFRRTGNEYIEGIALGNLGEAYLGLRRYDEALSTFQRVLELCRTIGHRHGEGQTMIHLGEAYLGLRRYGQAIDHLSRALALCRQIGDRHGEGQALNNLAHAHHVAGRPDTARRHWQAAVVILDGLADHEADEIRVKLRTVDQPAEGLEDVSEGQQVEPCRAAVLVHR
jgi:tetratricopeptide (TPR) repeat protein/transcriptional regulator with XRE-family HTH domain